MADVILESPPCRVSLIPGYVEQGETTLRLICHDHWFEKATFTDEAGTEIFHLKSKYGRSWSFRRSLYDSTGKHVLDFRHHKGDLKNRWIVEDASGNEVAEIVHAKQLSSNHSDVNMTIPMGKEGREDAVVSMRQRDRSALTVAIGIEDATVGEIQLLEKRDRTGDLLARNGDRSTWKIRVTSSMDLSVVVAVALCRAEMCHVWEMKS